MAARTLAVDKTRFDSTRALPRRRDERRTYPREHRGAKRVEVLDGCVVLGRAARPLGKLDRWDGAL